MATKGAKDTNKCLHLRRFHVVRQTAYAIHEYLRHGHLEKVYENALVHRLKKLGLDVKPQCPLVVRDEDGTVIGDYYADLQVEDCMIVEIKACKTIIDEHLAQLLGYLRSSRMEHGLLINFGARIFQIESWCCETPISNNFVDFAPSVANSICRYREID